MATRTMAVRQRLLLHPAAKPLVFLLCLLPFAWLFYAALTNQLGANPQEALIRATGDWTLRFLCMVLTVTPLRVISGTPALARAIAWAAEDSNSARSVWASLAAMPSRWRR